eukprot:581882-Ditylum_brightwellii.AAC.2
MDDMNLNHLDVQIMCIIVPSAMKEAHTMKTIATLTINIELRDNGAITTGTIVQILASLPVRNLMSGDIPMVETIFPIIATKYPQGGFDSIPINYEPKETINWHLFSTIHPSQCNGHCHKKQPVL